MSHNAVVIGVTDDPLEVCNWNDYSKLFLRREINLYTPKLPSHCMRAAFRWELQPWTRKVFLVKDPALQRDSPANTARS